MRIRRNILAPAVLAVGTIGSLVVGPGQALAATAASAAVAATVNATPNVIIMHGAPPAGSIIAAANPDIIVMHG